MFLEGKNSSWGLRMSDVNFNDPFSRTNIESLGRFRLTVSGLKSMCGMRYDRVRASRLDHIYIALQSFEIV